jgi:hypothetical protein
MQPVAQLATLAGAAPRLAATAGAGPWRCRARVGLYDFVN